jgi:hypothetical protein
MLINLFLFLLENVNLKRFNEGKSPVFTHVAASLQGLTTIRALGAEEKLISQFDDKQVIG